MTVYASATGAAVGRALDAILTARLDEIGALVVRAGEAAEAWRWSGSAPRSGSIRTGWRRNSR